MHPPLIFDLIFYIIFISDLATAVNVTQCFRCTSPGNPECDDEFDITQGVPVKCDSLIYLRKFEQPTDLIENVFIQERASNTTVFQFYCVKLGVQYQSKNCNLYTMSNKLYYIL